MIWYVSADVRLSDRVVFTPCEGSFSCLCDDTHAFRHVEVVDAELSGASWGAFKAFLGPKNLSTRSMLDIF